MEGLAGTGKGMESVMKDLPREAGNDKNLTILANPNVLFQKRLYGEFGPDLKRIRIRNNLPKLARKPEVYNRKLVSQQCFDAIDHVMHLRWAPDLLSTKEMEMYPTAAALNAVELLYGEAISRADLDGVGAELAAGKEEKLRPRRGKGCIFQLPAHLLLQRFRYDRGGAKEDFGEENGTDRLIESRIRRALENSSVAPSGLPWPSRRILLPSH